MRKTVSDLQNITNPVLDDLNGLENSLSNLFPPENLIINQINNYIIKSGGKRLRPLLVFLFAKMTGKITPEHHALACAVELIHSATLVHDDIVDDADKRRNLPSVHSKWGTKSAVLAGDFLLAKALEFLVQTKKAEILTLFSEITQKICEGEIEQFTNKNLLSVENYIERAKRKTGMLFNLCTQGACLISDNENLDKAMDYALNLGVAFQIADDLLLFKDNYNEKTTETDFENATLTLPVIFAAEEGIELDFEGDFNDFKQKIKNTNAIDKSYKIALQYKQRAIENLACFEDNEYRKSLLDLAEYIAEREF